MGFMIKVSSKVSTGKLLRKILDPIFLLTYVLLTIALVRGIIVKRWAFGALDWQHSVMNYALLLFGVIIIHVWLYLCGKFGTHYSEVATYFDSNKYKLVWEDNVEWCSPMKFRGRSLFEKLVKGTYFAVWCGITALVIWCLDELDYYDFFSIRFLMQNGGTITHVYLLLELSIFLIGLFLNYFSYFSSIMFSYFIRNVANKCDDLKYNKKKPSYTLGFHRLLHLSSRIDIAFFFESMMYVALVILCMALGGGKEKSVFLWLLTFCAMMPCLISICLVFVLSKAFLNRLLRKWKFARMKELENTNASVSTLDNIFKDKLTLLRLDIILAILTLIVNFGSLIFTAIQTWS